MLKSNESKGYSRFSDVAVRTGSHGRAGEQSLHDAAAAIVQEPQNNLPLSSGNSDPGFSPVLPFINQQPGERPQHVEWMPMPAATIGNCSPGLSYLQPLHQWLVHYQVELFEFSRNFGVAHKFSVKNPSGQAVYMAGVVEDFVARCNSPSHLHEGRIYDVIEAEIIHFSWSDQCKCCCCCRMPGYLNEIKVESPPGKHLATIKQTASMACPCFEIMDNAGYTQLMIQGNNDIRNGLKDPRDFIFEIQLANKDQSIVSVDLDINLKAALLSLVLFTAILIFEDKKSLASK
ncbi:uncharacterized protein TRIADDRAFT_56027 [Trichoplax adhaerens]|uniref:Phospholipid scramblase n=1 Tax=Trichoplax adhaerens TaxID=10228 RepID=B3RTS3_TRIAD|nr:hypothetical protein TRIADDRAFT_56027 [Trichoplax adhaerens]EDV26188.1 hypothetical protein TRIADDRAFT_56027 [Trichoplax adhaerens]|eukprot:XP_002112221.1 hypothetical protein TRIADDRAFT_56027 [Trichoplax adhaerens]